MNQASHRVVPSRKRSGSGRSQRLSSSVRTNAVGRTFTLSSSFLSYRSAQNISAQNRTHTTSIRGNRKPYCHTPFLVLTFLPSHIERKTTRHNLPIANPTAAPRSTPPRQPHTRGPRESTFRCTLHPPQGTDDAPPLPHRASQTRATNALTIAYVLTAGSEAMHAMMMEIIFDFGMKNVSTMVLWNVMGQYSKRLTKGNVQR